MDDVWFASDDPERLKRAIRKIIDLTGSMGIQVHKWGSNLEELIQDFPPHQRARTFQLNSEGKAAIKALGIVWDTQGDEFRFLQGAPKKSTWTLRTMSSAADQIYDPLGIISPTTLPGKLLIQNAWIYQKAWDEQVPDPLGKKMDLYCDNQMELHRIRVPRFMGNREGRLVLFSDASRMAQAAAAYWVTENPEPAGTPYQAKLIGSKVKLTGLQQVEHIGRLELIAAVMGVMLAVKICIAYGLPLEQVLFFTDSMAVLYWLSTTAQLSAYAGHRVAKICERTRWDQWRYVNTKMNPSDLPTRGVRAKDMPNADLWWEGPEFLKLPMKDWPEQPPIRKTEEAAAEERTVEEICKGITMTTHKGQGWDVIEIIRKRRANLKKQVRILSKVFEFIKRYLSLSKFDKTLQEIEMVLVKHDQAQKFREMIEELKLGKFGKTYPNLRPFLDRKGAVRIDAGFHQGAAFDWEAKRPILLHADMPFTKALLREIHAETLGHQNGIEGILAEARKRFWVVGGRKEAKRTIRDCMRCSKKRWTSLGLDLPPLHPSRSNPLRAFLEIGIDHAGPFKMR